MLALFWQDELEPKGDMNTATEKSSKGQYCAVATGASMSPGTSRFSGESKDPRIKVRSVAAGSEGFVYEQNKGRQAHGNA